MTSPTRYVATELLTMADHDAVPIPDGVVDVADGVITYAGPAGTAPEPVAGGQHVRIDGVLMPGMVNAHAHSAMVLLRGAGEGLPVLRWLREVMWPAEAALTSDDVAAGMRLGSAELLAGGITTSVEMYFQPDALAGAAAEVGMRSVVAAPIIDEPELGTAGTWEAQVDAVLGLAERWADHPLVEIAYGPHDAVLPEACLRRIGDAARSAGLLVHTHVAESPSQVARVLELTGAPTVPAHLDEVGLLDGRFLAAHAVVMTDEDLTLFADRGAAIAHCPCSNTKHASGIARLHAMREAGITTAIATDGPASHHRLDLFEEMRTALRLAKVTAGDAELIDAATALRMVTADAADAIGRPDLGRLVAGSRADMVALRRGDPVTGGLPPGFDATADAIVWSGSPRAVDAVWVDGRQVVADGVPTTVDLAAAVDDVAVRAARLRRAGA